jgi:hypothetical protein
MPTCQAQNCSQPTLIPSKFLYVVNLSNSPPDIQDIFVLHSRCDTSGAFRLQLSGILTNAKGVLGFAITDVDPHVMLKFLGQSYGNPSGWTAYHVYKSIQMSSYAFPPIAPVAAPSSQMLLASLTALATLPSGQLKPPLPLTPQFNPALLPNDTPGFADVVISTHSPLTAKTPFVRLFYTTYTIFDSTAEGMTDFGQVFIKVLEKLSILTNTPRWIKNNGNQSWPLGNISTFLNVACNNKQAAINAGAAGVVNLSVLLRQLSTNRSRPTINGIRVSMGTFNEVQLQAHISAVI